MPISSLVYLYDDHTRLVVASSPSPFLNHSFNPLSLSNKHIHTLSFSLFNSLPLSSVSLLLSISLSLFLFSAFSHSFSVSCLHSLCCPTRFPLSYRLPFSHLSPHVFLFFCLSSPLGSWRHPRTSKRLGSSRLESSRESRAPKSVVHPRTYVHAECAARNSLSQWIYCVSE